MLSRARGCAAVMLLLVGVCTASIPRQRLGRNTKPEAVSDAEWVPPFADHRCPSALPPKPLATPLPAFPKAVRGKVKMSFMIGTDGRLHNLMVLNSAGRAADSKAFNALRQWRYQPATCNGIPMEAEGTVEFPGR
jgi:TonB family protein